MADLNVQSIDADGLTPAYVAAAVGGDHLALGDGYFAHYKNGSGAPITVTVVTPGSVDGLAIADRALVVPAGGDLMFGLSSQEYKNPSTGRAHVTYSGVTSLTVAVLVH